MFDYQKLMFSSSTILSEPSDVAQQYYLTMLIGFDSQKQIHVVNSYKLLSFIGDIGGFYEALSILFSIFGAYFSSNLFKSYLVSDFFFVKNKGSFDKIKTSDQLAILDPILGCFFYCKSCRRQKKIVEKGMNRFEESLEVTSLLMKMN